MTERADAGDDNRTSAAEDKKYRGALRRAVMIPEVDDDSTTHARVERHKEHKAAIKLECQRQRRASKKASRERDLLAKSRDVEMQQRETKEQLEIHSKLDGNSIIVLESKQRNITRTPISTKLKRDNYKPSESQIERTMQENYLCGYKRWIYTTWRSSTWPPPPTATPWSRRRASPRAQTRGRTK